jgi:hypothetical protein
MGEEPGGPRARLVDPVPRRARHDPRSARGLGGCGGAPKPGAARLRAEQRSRPPRDGPAGLDGRATSDAPRIGRQPRDGGSSQGGLGSHAGSERRVVAVGGVVGERGPYAYGRAGMVYRRAVLRAGSGSGSPAGARRGRLHRPAHSGRQPSAGEQEPGNGGLCPGNARAGPLHGRTSRPSAPRGHDRHLRGSNRRERGRGSALRRTPALHGICPTERGHRAGL